MSPTAPRARRPNCREIGRWIAGYLDGELAVDRARTLREHLEACVPCGLELELSARVRAALSRTATPAPEDPQALARLRAFAQRLADAPDPESPHDLGI